MELKVNVLASTFSEALGVSEERINQLCQSLSDFLRPAIKKRDNLDRTIIHQHCASISENLGEYTIISGIIAEVIHDTLESVKEEEQREHEKTCESCRRKREAREAHAARVKVRETRRKVIEEELAKMEEEDEEEDLRRIGRVIILGL